MSIQFNCENCQQSLKVPEGSGGKKVRCPQCEAVNTIPAAEASSSPSPEYPAQAAATENPFAAPMTHTSSAPTYDGSPFSGELTHQTFELGEAFEQTWRRFKPRLGMGFLFGLVFIVISIASAVIGQIPQAAGAFGPAWIAVVAFIVSMLLQQVISAYQQCMGKRFGLNVARGNPEALSGVFTFARVFRVLLMVLLFVAVAAVAIAIVAIPAGICAAITQGEGGPIMITGVAITGVLALIAVGFGIFYTFRFVLGIFFIIDRDAEIMESLKLSYRYMTGNSLMWFVTLLLAGFLAGVVTLLTCGVGMFFVVGYMETLQSVIYLKVTGQYRNIDAI